nr:MAG: NUMOD4 motif [Bacteriophage sp.]
MTNQEFIKSISLEGEIWKDVIGYEGLYMVSSFGRIISLGRRITRPSHPNGFYLRQPKIMKQSISKSGYNKVILKVNGISELPTNL